MAEPKLVLPCHVRVHSLKAKPELNGAQAIAVSYSASTERYAVYFGNNSVLALKSATLEVTPQCKPLSLREASDMSTLVKKLGWAKTRDVLEAKLQAHGPQLCSPKTVHPMQVLARWMGMKNVASEGSHIWALAVLGALLQTVANVRGDDSFLDGIEMTPRGLQKLYERSWKAGYGDGEHYQQRMVGKVGSVAHTGPADIVEVAVYLGVDAWVFNVLPPGNEVNDAAMNLPSASTAAEPQFDGPQGATLAAVMAVVQHNEGLPVLLQTAGGAPLQWISGYINDAEGPMVLDPAVSLSSSLLVWKDLPQLLARSKASPVSILAFRTPPLPPETRKKLSSREIGDMNDIPNVFNWVPERPVWVIPRKRLHSAEDHAFATGVEAAIHAAEHRIKQCKSHWGHRSWGTMSNMMANPQCNSAGSANSKTAHKAAVRVEKSTKPVTVPGTERGASDNPRKAAPAASGASAELEIDASPAEPPAKLAAFAPSVPAVQATLEAYRILTSESERRPRPPALSHVVDGTVGYWPEPSDVVSAEGGTPVPLPPSAKLLSPPTGWPSCFKDDGSLKRMMGKRGLGGRRCREVEARSEANLRKMLGSKILEALSPMDSFGNSEAVAVGTGWQVIKGYALYEVVAPSAPKDAPTLYVAHKRWWNQDEQGVWIDVTPRMSHSEAEGTKSLLVLLESDTSLKEKQPLSSALRSLAHARIDMGGLVTPPMLTSPKNLTGTALTTATAKSATTADEEAPEDKPEEKGEMSAKGAKTVSKGKEAVPTKPSREAVSQERTSMEEDEDEDEAAEQRAKAKAEALAAELIGEEEAEKAKGKAKAEKKARKTEERRRQRMEKEAKEAAEKSAAERAAVERAAAEKAAAKRLREAKEGAAQKLAEREQEGQAAAEHDARRRLARKVQAQEATRISSERAAAERAGLEREDDEQLREALQRSLAETAAREFEERQEAERVAAALWRMEREAAERREHELAAQQLEAAERAAAEQAASEKASMEQARARART